MTDSKQHKRELMIFLIVIFIVGIGIFYLGPSIFYFVTKEISYTDNVGLVVTANGSYTWQVQNAGALKSVKLAGKVTTYGKARVYIEDNGIRYLIFDSTKLNAPIEAGNKSNLTNLITVFAAKENQNDNNNKNEEGKKNKKPEWTGTDEINVNSTTTINLSQYFTDKDGDSLIYAASSVDGINVLVNNELVTLIPVFAKNFNTTITFTASDGIDSKSELVSLVVYVNISPTLIQNQSINVSINETLNQTQQANKSIAINLSYKSGTIYDANDDGEESVNGIVDLTVEGTKFTWNADQSKLCSKWSIYNDENPSLTSFCNGNSDCCAFMSLSPSKSNWNEIYYAAFGKDGAGHSNIVYTQVVYYDVNLSPNNLKSEIYHSELSNISVKFFDQEKEFSNECIETCSLSGLNKSSYKLIFEIEDDAVLKIDKIQYVSAVNVKNNEPILLQNFSIINIIKNKNTTINLSDYFADPDGDVLTYSYYKPDNITILFENTTATIVPDKNFEGIRFTYIAANDSEKAAVSNLFIINTTQINLSELTRNELNSLIIQNSSGYRLAIIDSSGNMKIKGELIQNTEPIADINDFVVKNSSGGLNLVLKNPEGDLIIKGTLHQNQSNLNSPANSFVVTNSTGTTVAYLNNSGDLILVSLFTQFVDFS